MREALLATDRREIDHNVCRYRYADGGAHWHKCANVLKQKVISVVRHIH